MCKRGNQKNSFDLQLTKPHSNRASILVRISGRFIEPNLTGFKSVCVGNNSSLGYSTFTELSSCDQQRNVESGL